MEVGPDVLQVLVIKADMMLDDDLARIVDTTISTFGQIDILVRQSVRQPHIISLLLFVRVKSFIVIKHSCFSTAGEQCGDSIFRIVGQLRSGP